MRRSILTEKLSRRGQHIAREYSVDVYEMLRVGDVMDPQLQAIPSTTKLGDLADRIACGDPATTRRQACIILDADKHLSGIITRGDVLRALGAPGGREATVVEAGEPEVVVTHPDATLYDAVALLLRHDIGRLVVVERSNPRRVVGYLGRGDILAARQRHHREEDVRERGPRLQLPWPRRRTGPRG